jgi:hypothetical protein
MSQLLVKGILRDLRERSPRRRLFVSYHHALDQYYYDVFRWAFHDTWRIVTDRSLDRIIDSDDPDYVMRRIREQHISGTTCTVVLCGAHTRWRKYVDWEIKATLDRAHGLIGVDLPSNPSDCYGRKHIPDRLWDNIDTGYALWVSWAYLMQNPALLQDYVEAALARHAGLIDNSRPMRRRNGP